MIEDSALRKLVTAFVAKTCEAKVTAISSLAGGDINHALRVETGDGPLFLKWNPAPVPRLFETEAAGLEALRAAGSRLAIPEVLGWSEADADAPGFLLTTFLAPARRDPDFDTNLGEGLAELHATTGPTFGFTCDNYLGTTPQPNPETSSWLAFYAEHRLGHQVRLARDGGHLSASDARSADRLCHSLDRWIEETVPALIHGDLWAGNLHADGGRPALIDPATYYAHPEAELGMMTLFGGFSETTFQAYEEASDLAPDWRDRQPLYQLYHILNHANLFGGGYGGQAMRIVRRFAG